MFNYRKAQKGQAIVLIALAIVGLIGITALAIDSGNAFADRRHAQTAADNASLAGALVKSNPLNLEPAIRNQILQITGRNGYPDGEVESTIGKPGVIFKNCRGETVNPVDPTDPNDNITQYVEVMIRSSVNTFFGPVIGINKLDNCVYAIARAEPERTDEFMYGQAVAALNCHAKDAIKILGTANVTIIGGGIFSNSDSTDRALYIGSTGALGVPKPPISSVGVAEPTTIPLTTVTTGVTQQPCGNQLPEEMLPPPPPAGCNFTYDDFPPDHTDDQVDIVAHAPVYFKKSGVYCINGVLGNPDMDGSDVKLTFVLVNQGLTWSSNTAFIHLYAPTDPTNPYNGILIYAPAGNTSTLSFNGTSQMDIEGSIIAPTGKVIMNGDFGDSQVKSQIIGDQVEFSGSFTGTINFDNQVTHKYIAPPRVELSR